MEERPRHTTAVRKEVWLLGGKEGFPKMQHVIFGEPYKWLYMLVHIYIYIYIYIYRVLRGC